jgi:nitrogen fixation protein NifQ
MVVTESGEPSIDPATVPLLLRSDGHEDDRGAGPAAIYFILTGYDPVAAEIEQDHSFDRHVLASILSVAAAEGGSVAERAGLSAQDFAALIAQWFPSTPDAVAARSAPSGQVEDDEIAMVRDLLLAQRSNKDDVSGWLAAMIARRAMEPNHLWEDLGLRERAELSRLLMRHFAPLAVRNTKNMKWKRFFYRMLCEDDGFVRCATPVCTQCNDFDLCFGEESGESRMAERRREVSLRTAELSVATATSRFQERDP